MIVDRKTHKELIEIKKSATFKPKMLDAILEFKEKNDKSYLLYQGTAFPHAHATIINYQDYLDPQKT